MSADAELLRSLCLAPGPTGFEAPVQEVVRRRLTPLGEMQGDALGDVWLDVGPAGGPQVVVTAHADQIGLVDDLEAAAHLVAALARRVGESGAPESFVPRT